MVKRKIDIERQSSDAYRQLHFQTRKRSKVGCNDRVEFVLASLIALRGRKAFEHFGSMEAPEKLSGVVLEES